MDSYTDNKLRWIYFKDFFDRVLLYIQVPQSYNLLASTSQRDILNWNPN